MRRYWIVLILLASAVLPVIIGASCPPPSTPYFTSTGITTGRMTTSIPDCSPGFVCISIVNTTSINAQVGLYLHDGFDIALDYCQWRTPLYVGTPQSAAMYCPGYNLGEFQIARPQLFNPATFVPPLLNSIIYPIDGATFRTLFPRESVLVRIPEGDIKTFGLQVGMVGSLPASPALDDGPYYRCTQVPLGTILVPRVPEDVPSGETFQFVIFDELDGSLPGTAVFTIRTGTSGPGRCPTVQ